MNLRPAYLPLAFATLWLCYSPTQAADPAPGSISPFNARVEKIQKAAHTHEDGSPAYLTELEKGFRALRQDFPNEAEVYAELLFVADHKETGGSVQLAHEILAWPAPDALKEKARGVIRKKEAVGRHYDLQLKSIDGTAIDLSKFQGRVVLIDFWATWCGPCRTELPNLKKTYEQLHPQGLEIVGISFDDDLTKLRKFVTEQKMSWPQHCPAEGWNGRLAQQFGITSIPGMWLIDKQGHLRDLDARGGAGLDKKIEALLAE